MILVDSAPVLMICDCDLSMRVSAVDAAEAMVSPMKVFVVDDVMSMVCVTLFLIDLHTSRSPFLRLVTEQVWDRSISAALTLTCHFDRSVSLLSAETSWDDVGWSRFHRPSRG